MKKTICLNMIVRDESAVIERCLCSVRPWIDYWVIVDTGSKDNTQRIIRECFKGTPGELHERPWVNFADNRNEALQLAKDKADYLLFIDADERLELSGAFDPQDLTKDLYEVVVEVEKGLRVRRTLFVKSSLSWKWVGAVHETIVCSEAKSFELLKSIVNQASQDGRRSKNLQKFLQDAEILEKALAKNPHNARNVFYLAFSYEVGGRYEKALKNYQKLIEDFPESSSQEIFYALYRIAWLRQQLDDSFEAIIDRYVNAFMYRPSRIEPLFCLSHFLIQNQMPLFGYLISKYAFNVPLSSDAVLVDGPVYEYRVLEQWADSCLLLQRYDEMRTACRILLDKKTLPEEDRVKIQKLLKDHSL